MISGKYLEQIKTILVKDSNIATAYLFGSRASGKADSASDYDIAVYLDKKLSEKERFAIRLDLIGKLSEVLKTDRLDLVVINDVSSVFFKYVIIKEGKLLYQRRLLERCELEGRILAEYFDFQPFLEEYNRQYLAA